MFSISAAINPKKSATNIPVGTYSSVVTSVAYAADYVKGKAIEVQYSLTAADGSVFKYKEIFHNNRKNPRTDEFFRYLESLGISLDQLEDFVGTTEELVLKKSGKGKLLTIESRRAI